MKLRKIIIAATSLTIAPMVMAVSTTGSTSTSTKSLKNIYQKLKESPLSMGYYFDIDTVRNKKTTSIQGWNNTSIVSFGYKLSDKDSLSLSSRWDTKKISSENNGQEHTKWNTATANYYRSSLLTQDKHGVDATFHLRARGFMEGVATDAVNQGYIRPGVIFSRSLTSSLRISAPIYLAQYIRNNGDDGVNSNYLYVPASLGYGATDKLSFSLTAEYFRTLAKGEGGDKDSLDLTLSTGYRLSKAVGLGLSASPGTLLKSNDGKTIADSWNKNFMKNIGYTFSANFSVF